MEGTENQARLEIHHRVTGDNPVVGRLADAFFGRLDVLLRDNTAHDFIAELIALTLLERLNDDFGVAILTATTGLADKFAHALGLGGDGFAIGDLRFAGGRFYLELTEKTVANDLQVELAHTGNDGLAGFFIRRNNESRILFGEALEANGETLLVTLGIGLHGHADNGLGERRRLKNDIRAFRGQSVARADFPLHQ